VGLNDLEKGMFHVVASLEKSSQGALVIRELSQFSRLYIPPLACANLLCHDFNFGLITKTKGMEMCKPKVQHGSSHPHSQECKRV
jgi:hypothetical protein